MLQKLWFNLAYLSKPIWDTGVSPPELKDYMLNHTPGRALDLGCGTGTNTITLAKNGWQVSGVDFSRRAIHIAERKAQQNSVLIDFHLEDVTQLKSISGKFDLILDIGCFHSLPSSKRPQYIENIDHFLAQGGTFLIYLFLKENADSSGPGVSDQEIQSLAQKLKLIQRKDSSERGIRPSAWLTFNKTSETS
jgi:cyclopropane fatty-acyl-phospholipid synthase-like methyltransferase